MMSNFGERMQQLKRERGNAARASLHEEFLTRLREKDTPATSIGAAVRHHNEHDNMMRTSNGNHVCGLGECVLHYPKTVIVA